MDVEDVKVAIETANEGLQGWRKESGKVRVTRVCCIKVDILPLAIPLEKA